MAKNMVLYDIQIKLNTKKKNYANSGVSGSW